MALGEGLIAGYRSFPPVGPISALASDESFFISTAESALEGIAALVPVGSVVNESVP